VDDTSRAGGRDRRRPVGGGRGRGRLLGGGGRPGGGQARLWQLVAPADGPGYGPGHGGTESPDPGGNATRINSLDFSVADTRGLEDRARTDAVHQAVAHARSMAVAAGEQLGPVCSLTDRSQTENYNEPFAAGLPSATSNAPAAVPLEAGSQQETAQVSMVYALLPPPLRK
jgi:hypothetical protein